jgi:hypothetical protein
MSLLLIGLLVSGCTFSMRRGKGAGGSAADGLSCDSKKFSDFGSTTALITASTCVKGNPWRMTVESRGEEPVMRIYKQFDDRHPNQADAAVMAVVLEGLLNHTPLTDAMAFHLAGFVDEAQLAQALEAMALDDGTRKAFADRFQQAKASLSARTDKLDERRKAIYLAAPRAVIEARKAYFERYAAQYGKLDALEARAATAPPDIDPLLRDMSDLRGEYLAGASDAGARFDPFVIELTRQMVVLDMLAKHDLLAQADSQLLREPAAGRHLFAVEVGTALYRATAAEKRKYEEYSAAKAQGADERALQARFGATPPVNIGDHDEWVGSDSLPDLAGVVSDSQAQWMNVGGIVLNVAPAAGSTPEPMSRVMFRDVVNKIENSSCYETGKITGIHWDGDQARVNYETVCSPVGYSTEITKVAPVIVPTREATGLRPGENLLVMVDKTTRTGVVVRSAAAGKRGEKGTTAVLQVRANRIKP